MRMEIRILFWILSRVSAGLILQLLIANQGMPIHSGRKGGVAKRKRSRLTIPIETRSVRPCIPKSSSTALTSIPTQTSSSQRLTSETAPSTSPTESTAEPNTVTFICCEPITTINHCSSNHCCTDEYIKNWNGSWYKRSCHCRYYSSKYRAFSADFFHPACVAILDLRHPLF